MMPRCGDAEKEAKDDEGKQGGQIGMASNLISPCT
jgi:hypothetical protein